MSDKKPSAYPVSLVDFAWYQQNIPCQRTCPVATPAGRYVRQIYRGEMDEAYRSAHDPNPLMHVCARICAHPCEAQCRRGSIDQPVSIRQLKRTISDYWKARPQDRKAGSAPATQRQERIAIIGAGPAGISAAAALLHKGYQVTVLEATDAIGGMLVHGIPPYRLPRDIIELDSACLRDLGAEIRTGIALGNDLTLDDLQQEGFSAVFIGPGAMQGVPLSLEGSTLPGIELGVRFLDAFNRGEPVSIGQRVAVIGGGNVAIDVARSVRRLPTQAGPRSITMLVLEARKGMLAFEDEIQEALEERIVIRNSVGPKRFLEQDGKVAGVEILRALRIFDDQGAFNPEFESGSEEVVEADTVIVAIGQRTDVACLKDSLDLTPRGTIRIDSDTTATSRPGVFAGGDGARGPRLAIDAVADGIRAAESIHCYLTGEKPATPKAVMRLISSDELPPVADRVCRQAAPSLPIEDRQPSSEVELPYSLEAAQREASRCLDCYIQTVFDSDRCILCGGCVDVCPMRCLRLVALEAVSGNNELSAALAARYGAEGKSSAGIAIIKDEEKCIRCGLCQKRCPTGTITMEYFEVNR